MNLLVYITISGGRVRRGSLEVLARMREIAAETQASLAALILSDAPDRYVDEVARHGAPRIYTVAHESLKDHLNAPVLAAMQRVIAAAGPDIVAMSSSEAVKDILGALATATGGSVLPEALSLDVREGGVVEVSRPVMAGKAIARVEASEKPVIVSVRPGVFTATEAPVEAEVVPVALDDLPSGGPTIREIVQAVAGGADLSEARVVVAAGRGVRDERGKQLVQELAEVLGGAVGSSRAVVENGLFEASTQIGQTGKTVSPDLYIGVGVSGAIQHVAGITGSRRVIAINRDPDAPIFQYADYGLVGDLYELVPALISEIRASRGH
jgi:electron transfer flavoprotein alpha subunit